MRVNKMQQDFILLKRKVKELEEKQKIINDIEINILKNEKDITKTILYHNLKTENQKLKEENEQLKKENEYYKKHTKVRYKEKTDNKKKMKEYEYFRKTILARDNYVCQECGSNYRLQVHHIKSKKMYPELIMEPSNCITLCIVCHSKTSSFFSN
jgi:hypothetical protein